MNPVAEKPDNQEPVRVVEIGVKGLFGLYDHTVKLKDERVTIIHGSNGVGKTVFLELIKDFLSGRFERLMKSPPFEHFSVHFANGANLSCKTELSENEVLYRISIKTNSYEWSVTNLGIFDLVKVEPDFSDTCNNVLREHISGPHSKINIFNRHNPIEMPERYNKSDWMEMWKALLSHFHPELIGLSPRLLAVNRLQVPKRTAGKPSDEFAIKERSKDLLESFSEVLEDFGQKSSQLEQTFPDRLIDSSDVIPNIDSLKQAFSDINQQRIRYEALSLLEESADAERFKSERLVADLSPVKLVAMALHAQDAKAKLDVLEPLAQRVERFLALMNSKLKNKSLRMERPHGLVVRDRHGVSIPLASLSTGEQHLFVLLYDLIFVVQPNQLVLIDEPEAGMHISWQREFVDDLLEIIQLNSFDVILATHSPDLVDAHYDLMIEFSAKTQEQ
jgi:predicted ATP-binding protein involved in virulence